MEHKNKIPMPFSDEFYRQKGLFPIDTDPFGAYTGVPKAPEDMPVQDVDDL